MEEEGKDIEGERWGIGMKKVIFGIVILCLCVPELVLQRKKEYSPKKTNKNNPKGNVFYLKRYSRKEHFNSTNQSVLSHRGVLFDRLCNF
jgi:hypothetical protein